MGPKSSDRGAAINAHRAQVIDFNRDGSYSLRYGMESPHQTAERLMTPTAILVAVGASAEPTANGGFFVVWTVAPSDPPGRR